MSRSHVARQVTCVFTMLLAFAGVARAEGLTADEVARRASASSPAAEAKKHDLEAAEAQREKAFYEFFPRISTSASYYRLSAIDNPAIGSLVAAPGATEGPLAPNQPLVAVPIRVKALENSTSVTTTLSVPLTDYVLRLVQAHHAASMQVTATERSLRAAERKAGYEGRVLYYQWVRYELESRVAAQNLGLSKEHLTHVKALHAADAAADADVARVEATVASSELLLEQTQNLALLQRERIAIAMHDTQPKVYEIDEDLTATSRATIADLESLVRIAQRDRPEIAASNAQVSAYEKQVSVAKAQSYPRIDAIGQTQLANPNQRYFPQTQDFHTTWQVGVQLTISPNDVFLGGANASAARARAATADAQRRELLDGVRAEVTEAHLAWRNARASIDTSARRITAAETSYRARRERFNADKATTVELTEAQTELFQARLDGVQARVALRLAQARIAYATGR